MNEKYVRVVQVFAVLATIVCFALSVELHMAFLFPAAGAVAVLVVLAKRDKPERPKPEPSIHPTGPIDPDELIRQPPKDYVVPHDPVKPKQRELR